MKLQKYTKNSISIILSVVISYGVIFAWNGLIAENGDTLTSTKWNEIINEINTLKSNSGTPSGVVVSYLGTSCPSGYFEANGQIISRSTYSDLLNAIGTTYGSGDGSTTFQLPDLRGEFIRGWDNSRGVDTGRVLGSNQEATGIGRYVVDGNNMSYKNSDTELITEGTARAYSVAGNATRGQNYFHTRPRNVALLYCIKY